MNLMGWGRCQVQLLQTSLAVGGEGRGGTL